MNFCVYSDTGAEVHGYFVPDGFSTTPCINVRLDGRDEVKEIQPWIFIEGARAQGAHQTGHVGFILSDENVPGITRALQLELSDPDSGLIFYRRDIPGKYIPKKVLRLETGYIPMSEIDARIAPHFQFNEQRAEHHGFETIRQMLEIIHQPSVYVAGRFLLKNFRPYIDYNIEVSLVALRDPYYEFASRLSVLSHMRRRNFSFVSSRDKTLLKPVIEWADGLDLQDESALAKAIRRAPKDTLNLLASPFTQQLVASSPSDVVGLDDVSQALDALSQFTIFDSGGDEATFPSKIEQVLGMPSSTLPVRRQLERLQEVSDKLRKIGRVGHLLEADLVLYHFIQQAERRAFTSP